MINKIKELLSEVEAFKANTIEEIEEFRIKFLSKKGIVADLFSEFKNVPNQEKKEFGQKMNELKNKTSSKI